MKTDYSDLSPSELAAAYDILEVECHARAEARDEFVENLSHMLAGMRDRPGSGGVEYRFFGSLGAGGKFWVNNGRVYVNAYREDETPARVAAIDRANARLAQLFPPLR